MGDEGWRMENEGWGLSSIDDELNGSCRLWKIDSGCWIYIIEYGFRIMNYGLWIIDFGLYRFWIMDSMDDEWWMMDYRLAGWWMMNDGL